MKKFESIEVVVLAEGKNWDRFMNMMEEGIIDDEQFESSEDTFVGDDDAWRYCMVATADQIKLIEEIATVRIR
jgi:hypothetical protein